MCWDVNCTSGHWEQSDLVTWTLTLARTFLSSTGHENGIQTEISFRTIFHLHFVVEQPQNSGTIFCEELVQSFHLATKLLFTKRFSKVPAWQRQLFLAAGDVPFVPLSQCWCCNCRHRRYYVISVRGISPSPRATDPGHLFSWRGFPPQPNTTKRDFPLLCRLNCQN